VSHLAHGAANQQRDGNSCYVPLVARVRLEKW
jgi:hypothetical protein